MQDPREVEPSVPDALAEIILRMGERRADKRFDNWSEIKEGLSAFIKSYDHEDTLPTIAQLQEDLIGDELDKKSQEATGATPQNFMINLQSPGTVPIGPGAGQGEDEDDIATQAHQISRESEDEIATKVDTPPSKPTVAVAPANTPENTETTEPEPRKAEQTSWAALLVALVLGIGALIFFLVPQPERRNHLKPWKRYRPNLLH